METAWYVIRKGLVEAYDSYLELVIANLLWFVLTLPIITAPLAAAGLYYSTNQLAHRKQVSWRTFFEGFHGRSAAGLRWSLLNLVAILGIVANVWFYGNVRASWGGWVQGLFVGLLILWLLLQVYTFPLLLEQQEQRMRQALRNSLVLFIRKPFFSLGLVIFLALILGLSTYFRLPWVIFTASLTAYLANRCTIYLLRDLQNLPQEEV